MNRLNSSDLYELIGFTGNCDEGLTIDYVKSEIVDKADNGDSTAIFKLNNIVRHCTDEAIVNYAKDQLNRLDGVGEISKVEEISKDDKSNPNGDE